MFDPYSSIEYLRTMSHMHRDQAAINRARLVYQYHDGIPLAPRDYGMPHQANTSQILVHVRTAVKSVAGLLHGHIRGLRDGEDIKKNEEEQTRSGDNPIGEGCESEHDNDW